MVTVRQIFKLVGTVTQSGDDLIYTPDPDFNGTDSFDYTIDDGNGGTATAYVNVTVTSVNDVPVAVNDSATSDDFPPAPAADRK